MPCAKRTKWLLAIVWIGMLLLTTAVCFDANDGMIAAIQSKQSPARVGHISKGRMWNTEVILLGNLAQQLERASYPKPKRLAAVLPPIRQRSVDALIASTLSQAET